MSILIGKPGYWKGILLANLALLSLAGCRKANGSDDDHVIDGPQPVEVDIHIAVVKFADGYFQPFYYKNGELQQLPANEDVEVVAQDIFVSGQDVYIVGYEGEEDGLSYRPKKAICWKNGAPQELPTPPSETAEAKAVFVSGNDVYVAGYYTPARKENIAAVWKNGELNSLTDGVNEARLTGVFVSGNDVYATGYEKEGDSEVAKYWKNGTVHTLGVAGNISIAIDVSVDNGDVYVTGASSDREAPLAKLWINDEEADLTPDEPFGIAGAMAVENGDIYVAGEIGNGVRPLPAVWKNGTATPLEIPQRSHGSAIDIAVLENNVYVIGEHNYDGKVTSVLWENDGEPTTIFYSAEDRAYLKGIFVTER